METWAKEQLAKARQKDKSISATTLEQGQASCVKKLTVNLPEILTKVRTGKTSPLWAGHECFDNIAAVETLMDQGNQDAARLLFYSLANLTMADWNGFGYQAGMWLRLLACHSALLASDEVGAARFRWPELRELTLYALHGGEIPVRAKEAFKNSKALDLFGVAVIQAGIGRRDQNVRKLLLKGMEPRTDMWTMFFSAAVFGRFGEPSDIPALESLKKRMDGYMKKEVEEVILLIRLRAAIQ